MLAVIDGVFVDEKIKESVTSSMKKVPLSDTSTPRRVELFAKDVSKQLLENLKKADIMSITVYRHCASMSGFIRWSVLSGRTSGAYSAGGTDYR